MQKIRQDISLGGNLRRLRLERRLTQEDIATRLQLLGSPTTRSVYSRYETGELNIRASDLIALKEILQCTYDEIFCLPQKDSP